jgi:peptide/nickel transport system substrate-binding protein
MHTLRKFLAAIILISSFIPTLSSAALIPEKSESPVQLRKSSEFVIAIDMNEEPFTFNPQKSTNINSAQLLTAISEGIVSYHPSTLDPVPGAANSIEPSEDGLIWTISIRKNAKFSNGDSITAYTFLNTWFHFIEKETAGDMASLLDVIKGVRAYRTGLNTDTAKVGIRALDRYTLELELITPAPYLLNILCHHIFAAIHPDNLRNLDNITSESFISSGPYQIVSANEEEIYLKKNPYYWDKDNVKSKHIRIELRNSGLDLLIDFSGELVHWSEAYIPIQLLYDEKDVIVYPEYSTGFYYFSENSGPYSMPKVREALSLLIPWKEIRENGNFLYPTETLIPQDTLYFGSTGITEADRDMSFQLLEEAGFRNGFGLPTIHLAIHPGEALEEITDQITDIWSSELGITVIIDIVPFSVYLGDPENSPYTMGFITWIGDFYDPYSFLNLWLSDSNFNPGKYQNPEFDSLIRKGLEQEKDADRFVYFREAENILLQQAAVIPISHGVSVNFINTDIVSGWYPNLLDIHPLKYFYTHEPSRADSNSF